MNLIHKMLRYGAIWLVSLFFQFWSFFSGLSSHRWSVSSMILVRFSSHKCSEPRTSWGNLLDGLCPQNGSLWRYLVVFLISPNFILFSFGSMGIDSNFKVAHVNVLHVEILKSVERLEKVTRWFRTTK